MTIYEDARYQVRWHQDNGRLVGATDLVLAALEAGEAAEAKAAEAERYGKTEDERWAELVAALRAAEAREKALREALRDLPCFFYWQARRAGGYVRACPETATGEEPIPEHAWCPACRARAALAAGKPETGHRMCECQGPPHWCSDSCPGGHHA